jgi:nucleoside-diphosphate-sugar epimerase
MPVQKVFVVGGTGAQGIPVVRGLVSDGQYAVKVLTRDLQSDRAKQLQVMSPKVELFQGSLTSEADLRKGLQDCDGLFLNIDGFTVGEKVETFWTMRIYELAVQYKIKHFIFANLDYGLRKGGYQDKYRTGHYDGKGRMADWLLDQHRLNGGKPFYDMTLAVFTTGPYIEMSLAPATPMAPRIETDESGEEIVVWKVPLTEQGAVVHVSLQDCAHYVRWLFDNPDQDGIDLEVAIDHVHYADLAAAFERVTGFKAKFVDVSFEEYWTTGPMAARAAAPAGYTADINEPGTLSVKDNFTGFWNLWRDSGNNKGVVKRDYALLDKIHPQRIRTVEQFFRLEDEKARAEGSNLLERVRKGRPVLKIHDDALKRMAKV